MQHSASYMNDVNLSRLLSSLLLIGAVMLIQAPQGASPRSSECKYAECSHDYERKKQQVKGQWPDDLFSSPLSTPPTPELCQVFVDYSDCLRATSRSCRGRLDFHTILHVVERWEKEHNCSVVLERAATDWSYSDVADHCKWRPQRLRHGYPVFSHCAFFGHPHLLTFSGDIQTCGIEGAWPLLDNEHIALQVTNTRVCPSCSATATTTVSVVLKAQGDCSQQVSYEGSTASLPSSFIGGHFHGGGERAAVIREIDPGKHVEIWAAHAGIVVVIRRFGRSNYLNVAVRLPSELTGEETHTQEKLPILCTKGCPSTSLIRTGLDDPAAEQILKTCRNFQVTDYFLDACVFDVLATGDEDLSWSSKHAQEDFWSLSPEVASNALTNRSYLLVSSSLTSPTYTSTAASLETTCSFKFCSLLLPIVVSQMFVGSGKLSSTVGLIAAYFSTSVFF